MQVLVVEDEPIIAEDTVEMLREAGHEVAGPVSSVDEAVRLAEETRADLALVDVNLWGEEEGPRPERARARQHRDAAVGVLSKPFAAQELVQSVPVARAAAVGEESRSWRPRNLELFRPV